MHSKRGKHIDRRLIGVGALLTLAAAGCGAGNGSSSPSPPHVNPPSQNVLQLAVGTANVYGTTGLNVVSTYRQPNGDSGSAVNSPTLTLQNALAGAAGTADASNATILTGPAPSEVGGSTMQSTAQGGTTVTTFGTSQGAFGIGIEPYNYNNQVGGPYSVAPNPVPVYDAIAADPNQLPAAWCGPPACDLLGNGQSPVGNGNVPAGTAGIGIGLDVFAGVAPVAGGAYSLTVSVPANTGVTTQSKSFTLPALVLLPAFTPAVPALDANGDGGATFAVNLPAGVSEAYVEIIDVGPVQPTATGATAIASCNGSSLQVPVYYTLALRASGSFALGPLAGPGGTPSLCTAAQNSALAAGATGDQFVVQALGFDYPLFESSYPTSSGNQSPAIVGVGGSDDITISTSAAYVQATARAPLTAIGGRRALFNLRGRANTRNTR